MAKFLSGKLLAYKVSTGKRLIKLRLDSNFGFIKIQYIITATRNSIIENDPVECKPTKKHYPNPPSLSFNCQSRDSRRKIVSPQTKWSKKEEKKHQRTSFVHNCPRKRSLSSCSLASVVYCYTAHKTGPVEPGDI